MANSWGPVTKPVHRTGAALSVGEEGQVTEFTRTGFQTGPRHPVNYDATDARHNRESGLAPWTSVDVNSGVCAVGDFVATSRFPDGPGAWRQT